MEQEVLDQLLIQLEIQETHQYFQQIHPQEVEVVEVVLDLIQDLNLLEQMEDQEVEVLINFLDLAQVEQEILRQ